jgi:hypothetical protein
LTYLKNPDVFRVQEGMVEALEVRVSGSRLTKRAYARPRGRLMRGAIRYCADPTAAFANGSFDHHSLALTSSSPLSVRKYAAE